MIDGAKRAAAVAVGLLAVVASGAHASTIYYRCGGNVCSIRPDGSGKQQLTSDGGYSTPSISRDGTKLAFVHSNTAYVSDPTGQNAVNLGVNTALLTVMRPDGGKVAVINEQQEAGGSLTPYLVDVNPDGSGYANESRAVLTTGYVGTTLVRDGYSATSHLCQTGSSGNCPAYSICVVQLTGPRAGSCGANVADDPTRNLYDPAGSPDGTLVAAAAVPYPNDGTDYGGTPYPPATSGAIAVYNASTGALVRNLTTGTDDSQPAWSPDGTEIAFSRGSSVYVISATGAPGSERLLTAGDSPSWGAADTGGGGSGGGGGGSGGGGSTGGGGGSGGVALTVASTPHEHVLRQQGLVERVHCTSACALAAVGQVQVRGAGLFTTATVRTVLAAGGSAQLTLKLSRKALRAIANALKHRRRVVAEIGAVVQSGNQRKTATKKFVITS